jgi:hypothetical protein
MRRIIFILVFVSAFSSFASSQDSAYESKFDSLDIIHYQQMIQQLEDQKKKQTELQPYIKIEAQIDLLYYLIEEKNLKLKNKK